jgi:hypothetical protein
MMMHGHEKSDHVTVAMKPANKAKESRRNAEARSPWAQRTKNAPTGRTQMDWRVL